MTSTVCEVLRKAEERLVCRLARRVRGRTSHDC